MRCLFAFVATLALVMTGVPAVQAQSGATRDSVADADRATGTQAERTLVSGSTLVLNRGDVSVVLSQRPDSAVALISPTARLTVGVPALTLARFDRNNAVFASGDSADIVTRVTAEGGQILATIRGADAPTRFRFPIVVSGGHQLLLKQADGSVAVVVEESGALRLVAVVTAPWAVDAAGRQVSTRLEVSGSSIVQYVDHLGAAYPVVADPNITDCGIATCSLYIGRARTASIATYVQRYANASTAAIATAFGAACFPLGGYPALVCAGVAAVWGGFAIDQFVYAKSQKKCIRLRYVPLTVPSLVGIYVDGSGFCTA